MAKKIKLSNIGKCAFIISILLLLAVILILSLNVIPINAEFAAAAAPAYKGYFLPDGDSQVHFKVDSPRYIMDEFYDPNIQQAVQRTYYKVPFINGTAKWDDVILPDLAMRMDFQFITKEDGQNVDVSNIFDIALSKTAGASNTIYAYPTAFNITGTTWYGTSYSGAASALTVAGVYKISSITLSYYIGTKCVTHEELMHKEEPITGTPSSTPYAQGSVTLSSNIDILITADMFIDDTQSSIIGMTKNLNLTREATTYGSSTNFRNLVKLHSTESSTNNSYFTYSTQKTGYNIGNSDDKFFKHFSNILSGSTYVPHNYGFGIYPEQSNNLERNDYPNTTLIGINSRLSLQWNTGAMTGEQGTTLTLTEIQIGTPIVNAGMYYLRIVSTAGLIGTYQPVTVKHSSTGVEYIQELEIYKKQLNLDLVGTSFAEYNKEGLILKTEKEYDKSVSALGLFNNKTLSMENWLNIGGVSADYTTALNLVISSNVLFDFVGSVFDSADIGDRNVTMYINMLRLSSGDNSYGSWLSVSTALAQYEPIPGRYIDGEFEAYTSSLDTNGDKKYVIEHNQIPFKIIASGINITFNTAEFSGAFIYGQYLTSTAFAYQRYADGKYYNSLTATNTTMNALTGKIGVNNFDNWQIAFVSKTSDMATDSSKNIIYVMPMVGKKLLPDDTNHTKAFVDSGGQEYYAISGKLFADSDYYLYYSVYVYFSTGNIRPNLAQQADSSFNIPKDFGSSEAVLKLTIGPLLNLNIQKREVLLTINECATNKVYDGTKAITLFSASASNIVNEDAQMIELGYSIEYSTAGVGTNIPIIINYTLKPKAGWEDQPLENVMGSYAINTSNYTNNSGVNDITKGNITPLTLGIKFVRTNYTRKFNEALYVVVRVAKAGDIKSSGEVLQEDLFYFYAGTVDEPFRDMFGFCRESELESIGIFNYVVVEISGFMAGEGFTWDEPNTLRDFMTDMTFSEPVIRTLNSSLLLSWYDSVKGVAINKLTDSSQHPEDTYRLEFSDGIDIAPNYIINPIAPNLAYLYIEKLTPDEDVIVIEGETAENYLVYVGVGNIQKLFDTGKVKYTNHKEYEQINNMVIHPSELLSVIDFTFSCKDGSHDHSIYTLSSPLVQNMTYSGEYILRLSLPSTANYLAASIDFAITIHTKMVEVYLTKAVRQYGESEVVYDTANPKYITDSNQYRYLIDSEGRIVEENGNVVYIYTENGEIVEGNFVMYQGLLVGDYFGSDQATDSLATVIVNPDSDKAGIYTSAITVSNASKHNYSFSYIPTTLYVLRKELTIAADPVQSKTYTGDEILPNYQIIGGVGNLGLYKIGKVIDGVDIFDDVEDETDTSIVEVGTYIIKIFAKPRVEDEVNYKVSDDRLIIRLTITEQEVVIIEQSKTASKVYDTQSFILEKFNYYFTGAVTPAKYSWGYLYIYQATVDGRAVAQMKDGEGNLLYLLDDYGVEVLDYLGQRVPIWDIRDSGVYTLSTTAIITNTNNTYFMESGNKVYLQNFEIILEIEKSGALLFSTVTSEGVYTVESAPEHNATYNQVYNGREMIFNYSLFASGNDYSMGEIPVTMAIGGILYSYNNNIYSNGAPIYNNDASQLISGKIDGVVYNILHRSKLLNVAEYYMHVYINTVGCENYNSNYVSLEYVYKVEVVPAKLSVYIEFKEGFGSYKVYGEDNTEIEKNVVYRYEGWVGEEGEDIYILAEIIPPTIDWSDVGDDAVAGDDYHISSMGGRAPSNYVFNHISSARNFVVRKADSWIRVYGFYNEETGVYADYNTYSGQVQIPKVIRMAGNTPIDTEVETVGEDGIKIVLEGLFIGSNKNNILPKDIDTSVKRCFDTGKYVFSVSVIASTNYKAVAKAYYYYEIVKADLEMVFVVQDFDGENYTITEVRGYASKVYDGDSTNYPAFTIQYKGFVGEDDDVNSYKNVFKVLQVGEIAYIIVGENTFQTFAKNFEYVQDGLGKYFRDSQGNYIMLNTKGNYIRDITGKYISVTSIKGNYYLEDGEYKIINGTHIKDGSNNYLLGSSIVGSHILDENNDYIAIGEVVGKYAVDIHGNYIKITDTFFHTESNSYVNIQDLIGIYYKDESGDFIKAHEAVGKYFKNYEGDYINIISALGNYSKEENGEFTQVEEGSGEYVRDEHGEYILLTELEGTYVKNILGQYLAVSGLQGDYIKDRDGRYFKVSEIIICPFIVSGEGGYVRVNYLTDEQDQVMLFIKDSLQNYINCANIIGTHILDEEQNFVKVRTYLGNLVSFTKPYVRTPSGDYVRFETVTAGYVLNETGEFILVGDAVAEYIRNSAGEYLKVADILGESIIDEKGNTVVVSESSAKYFCDYEGNYIELNNLIAQYAKIYDNQYIRVVANYVRLENFDFVKIDNLVYNYIKDSLGNYIKIRDEEGNILVGVMGNYIIRDGYYVPSQGTGTHILDEHNQYVRVNGDYELKYDGISKIGLINPAYEIFDKYGAISPTEVDTYKIRVLLGEFYGLSQNYNINIGYKQIEEEIAYPELEITKRPIDITDSNNMVTKVYDGYRNIPTGSLTGNNYVFLKVMVDGEELPNSGLVLGDTVKLRYDSSLSTFMRKTVLDENGDDTQNYVKIYGFSIDNPNYILQASNIKWDEYGYYLELLAKITPATAAIRFVDKNGKNVTNRLEVVYNAENHPINAIVQGVRFDDGSYEVVSYSINYFCERNNYNKQEPPKDAESYIVTLTIEDSNYVSTRKTVDLLINKAEVTIVFGGDTVQTYGSFSGALVAEARGIGGYEQTLQVLYYDTAGKYCEDITAANAGAYKARAIHYESTNFNQKTMEEDFTINRRNVSLYYDLSPTYAYSGVAVAPKIHFMYNGIKYEPTLKFNYRIPSSISDYVPFNYGDEASAAYPIGVGDYQLQAFNDMQNFNIIDTFWTNFSIVPINLTVSIVDLTVLTGNTISFNYRLQGQANNESMSDIFTQMPSVQYYTANNQKLSEAPTKAGLYKAEPYGGIAPNYNVTYKFGMLSINNSRLLAGGSADEQLVVVEGSFAANIDLNIREITNRNFSGYTTSFDAFKLAHPEYAGYHIIKIYYLSLSDGSVSSDNGGGELLIRLYVPELFDTTTVAANASSYGSIKKADDGSYYVAHINSQGDINMIQAYREGDYLCFNSNSLETYCILSTQQIKDAKNDDWILYVSISLGIILVGIALIIVRKRA